MSRNEDKAKGTEKTINFKFNIGERKSKGDLLEKNKDIKEIIDTNESSKLKTEEDKNQDIKEEEDKLKEIEEKCKLIFKELPLLYYFKMFDDEFIKFFQKGNNLELFAEIVDAIRNHEVDKNESSIIELFEKGINEDIL